eukprot:m.56414 g.56414  ORF g.56414 m.56414 type:complete len:1993 (+) comp11038_c0_seq1:97-6075(+)
MSAHDSLKQHVILPSMYGLFRDLHRAALVTCNTANHTEAGYAERDQLALLLQEKYVIAELKLIGGRWNRKQKILEEPFDSIDESSVLSQVPQPEDADSVRIRHQENKRLVQTIQSLAQLLNLNERTCESLLTDLELSCRQLSPGTHDIYRGVVSYHMAATELIHFLALFIHSAREDGPLLQEATSLFDQIPLSEVITCLLSMIINKENPSSHARTEMARLEAWKDANGNGIFPNQSDFGQAARSALQAILLEEEQAVADCLIFAWQPSPTSLGLSLEETRKCCLVTFKVLLHLAKGPRENKEDTQVVAPRVVGEPLDRITIALLVCYMYAISPPLVDKDKESVRSFCSTEEIVDGPSLGGGQKYHFFDWPPPWASQGDDSQPDLEPLQRFMRFCFGLATPDSPDDYQFLREQSREDHIWDLNEAVKVSDGHSMRTESPFRFLLDSILRSPAFGNENLKGPKLPSSIKYYRSAFHAIFSDFVFRHKAVFARMNREYSADFIALVSYFYDSSDDDSASEFFRACEDILKDMQAEILRQNGSRIIEYLDLLAGIAGANGSPKRNRRSALYVFEHLCGRDLSWDYFLENSLIPHAVNCQDAFSHALICDQSHPYHAREVKAFSSFLEVLSRVVLNDVAREALGAKKQVRQSLLLLVHQEVPSGLKTILLKVLCSFALSTDWMEGELWQCVNQWFADDQRQTILEEFITARREQSFGVPIAILSLLSIVLDAVPEASVVEGFTGHIQVLGHMFLQFPFAAYRRPSEKWELCQVILKIYKRFITSFVPKPAHFTLMKDANTQREFPGYHLLQGIERGGYELLSWLLGSRGEHPPRTLETLFAILHEGHKIGPERFRLQDVAFRKSVQDSMEILIELFLRQEPFVKGGGRRIENMMLDTDHTRLGSLIGFLRPGYPPELMLSALKIFWLLVHTAAPAGIFAILRNDFASNSLYRNEVLISWKSLIADISPENSDESHTEDLLYSDVSGNKVHSLIQNAVGFSALQVLLYCVKHMRGEVGFVHLILGFDPVASTKRDLLNSASVLHNSRFSILHGIVELLHRQKGVDRRLSDTNPILSEICFQLLYHLCRTPHSSHAVMQFLREKDFFVHQFDDLFPGSDHDAIRGITSNGATLSRPDCAWIAQQGWILNILALELQTGNYSGSRFASKLLSRILSRLLNDSFFHLLDFRLVWQQDYDVPGVDWSVESTAAINNLFKRVTAPREDLDGVLWCDTSALAYGLRELAISDYNYEKSLTEDSIRKIVYAAESSNLLRRANAVKTIFFEGWSRCLETALFSSADRPTLLDPLKRAKCTISALQSLTEKLLQDIGDDILKRGLETRISSNVEILSQTVNHLSQLLLSAMKTPDPKDVEGVISEVNARNNSSPYAGDVSVVSHLFNNVCRIICFEEALGPAREQLYGAMLQLAQIAESREGGNTNGEKRERRAYHQQNMDISFYIIENSIYVLWCHLEWYLKHCRKHSYDNVNSDHLSRKREKRPRHLHVGLGEPLSSERMTAEAALTGSSVITDLKQQMYPSNRLEAFRREVCDEQTMDGAQSENLLKSIESWRLDTLEHNINDANVPNTDNRGSGITGIIRSASDCSDQFMEILCRDATEDHGLMALMTLNTLVRLEAVHNEQSKWLSFMVRHGYLAHFIDQILQSNDLLVSQLELPQGKQDLGNLAIHKTRMALLMQVALTPSGADCLTKGETMWRLREFKFISLRPPGARIGGSQVQEGLSQQEWHREIVLPILRLAVTLLKCANDDQREEICRQVGLFINAHIDGYFRAVLRRQRDDALTEKVLEELSLTTSLFRNLFDHDRSGLAVEVLGANCPQVQALLLSLLSRFAERESVLRQVSVNGESYIHLKESQKQEIDGHVIQIMANVVGFTRSVMCMPSPSNPGEFHRFSPHCRIVLRPQYRQSQVVERQYPTPPPSVGDLVDVIKHSRKVYKASREAKQKWIDNEVRTMESDDMQQESLSQIIVPLLDRIRASLRECRGS